MSLHIGILMCNTDRSAFAARFENDGEKAATMLRGQRPDWQYTVLMTIDGTLPESVDAFDGYLLTGSPASVNDNAPWMPALFDFVRSAHAAGKPMVGLCFGHQAIAHALGGRVERAKDWGLGVAQTNFDGGASWMPEQPRSLQMHAAHEDQVVELPPGAQPLGGNDYCEYGAFAMGDQVFTTQYHPEFAPPFMNALVNDKIAPALPSAIVERAREQLAKTDASADSSEFASWVASFFEQANGLSS
jgi:GMP synthase-like glutamine amidotransferase